MKSTGFTFGRPDPSGRRQRRRCDGRRGWPTARLPEPKRKCTPKAPSREIIWPSQRPRTSNAAANNNWRLLSHPLFRPHRHPQIPVRFAIHSRHRPTSRAQEEAFAVKIHAGGSGQLRPKTVYETRSLEVWLGHFSCWATGRNHPGPPAGLPRPLAGTWIIGAHHRSTYS